MVEQPAAPALGMEMPLQLAERARQAVGELPGLGAQRVEGQMDAERGEGAQAKQHRQHAQGLGQAEAPDQRLRQRPQRHGQENGHEDGEREARHQPEQGQEQDEQDRHGGVRAGHRGRKRAAPFRLRRAGTYGDRRASGAMPGVMADRGG